MKKMIILPGNAAKKGKYVAEDGKTYPEWKDGALHEGAANDYARRLCYDPVVIHVGGWPQSEDSPQAKKAIPMLQDRGQNVTAIYGFSGGGYNLRHILEYLLDNSPETLYRIDRVVVLGAPMKKWLVTTDRFNDGLKKKGLFDPKLKQLATWTLEYRENPPPSAKCFPPGYDPTKNGTHMFGPEWLLADTVRISCDPN